MSEKLLMDFYYSAQAEVEIERIRRRSNPDEHVPKFKGLRYNIAVWHGQPSGTKWNDLQFVGTGTADDIQ